VPGRACAAGDRGGPGVSARRRRRSAPARRVGTRAMGHPARRRPVVPPSRARRDDAPPGCAARSSYAAGHRRGADPLPRDAGRALPRGAGRAGDAARPARPGGGRAVHRRRLDRLRPTGAGRTGRCPRRSRGSSGRTRHAAASSSTRRAAAGPSTRPCAPARDGCRSPPSPATARSPRTACSSYSRAAGVVPRGLRRPSSRPAARRCRAGSAQDATRRSCSTARDSTSEQRLLLDFSRKA
jgi:hypothetical protein